MINEAMSNCVPEAILGRGVRRRHDLFVCAMW